MKDRVWIHVGRIPGSSRIGLSEASKRLPSRRPASGWFGQGLGGRRLTAESRARWTDAIRVRGAIYAYIGQASKQPSRSVAIHEVQQGQQGQQGQPRMESA